MEINHKARQVMSEPQELVHAVDCLNEQIEESMEDVALQIKDSGQVLVAINNNLMMLNKTFKAIHDWMLIKDS